LLLGCGKKVEQKCSEARMSQKFRNESVAGGVAAASASMREYDNAFRVFGNGEITFESDVADRNRHRALLDLRSLRSVVWGHCDLRRVCLIRLAANFVPVAS